MYRRQRWRAVGARDGFFRHVRVHGIAMTRVSADTSDQCIHALGRQFLAMVGAGGDMNVAAVRGRIEVVGGVAGQARAGAAQRGRGMTRFLAWLGAAFVERLLDLALG